MSNERELFEQFANEHKMSVLRVADAYSDDDTNYAWWVWQKATASTPMQDDVRKDDNYEIYRLRQLVYWKVLLKHGLGEEAQTELDKAIDKARE